MLSIDVEQRQDVNSQKCVRQCQPFFPSWKWRPRKDLGRRPIWPFSCEKATRIATFIAKMEVALKMRILAPIGHKRPIVVGFLQKRLLLAFLKRYEGCQRHKQYMQCPLPQRPLLHLMSQQLQPSICEERPLQKAVKRHLKKFQSHSFAASFSRCWGGNVADFIVFGRDDWAKGQREKKIHGLSLVLGGAASDTDKNKIEAFSGLPKVGWFFTPFFHL